MISLLARDNKAIQDLSDNTRRLLSERHPQAAYQGYVKYLRKNQYRLRCQCGLILHVVFDPDNQSYFFRRNPGQQKPHEEACPFYIQEQAEGKGRAEPKPNASAFRRSMIENTYLLNIPRNPVVRKGSAEKQRSSNGARSGIKYAGFFNYLFHILETLGINTYPNKILERNANWDDLYRCLQNTPYGPFCWCPTLSCRGGLAGLNIKLLTQWKDIHREPEAIVLGILDQVPRQSRFCIPKFPEDPYPLAGAAIARHQISVIGKTGPYLFLAACTAQALAPGQTYAAPVFNRMIMQAIVSWNSLIPVDSDHERKVAKYLMYKATPFLKPLFSEGPECDLRPDFIVGDRFILEVQGMDTPEYRQRKADVHQRMEQHYQLPVMAYHPQIDDLATMLRDDL